ncbi:MAG: DUF3713 domain-containing protein [Mycoplasmoidaceae bacterium]
MKRRKSKAIFLATISLGLLSIVSSTSLLLVSCSAAVEDDKNRIDKGDGKVFANNGKTGDEEISVTLQEVAEDSLFNESSMKKNIEGRIGDVFYKAIEKIAEGNAIFARDLKNKNKEIEENLKQTEEQLQKSNPSKWEEEFQDTHLDPNGGTKDSYIAIKKNEWALTYLTDKIFEKSLVVVNNGSNAIKTPQLSDLMNALNKKDGFSFTWESEDKLENKLYAPIQKFVFDKWLKFEKPMIINMSLWKYGAPQGGINSIYNSNITPPPEEETPPEEEESTFSTRTTDLAGNYAFPYFSESADNETFSSIEKFNNFIEDAKKTNNYILDKIAGVDNSAGLIDVPQSHTEDSSTYILAKASNIYDTLYPEFAMAALSLYYNKFQTTGNELLTSSNTRSLNNDISVLDDITKQFISSTPYLNTNHVKIPAAMVDKIINQFGDLTSLRGKDLYSSDAFKIADSYLSNFMMLRNEAGVHAIAIDGYKHIESSATAEDANKIYGDVIIYRHLLSERNLTNLNGNNNVSISLQSELKTYFTDNKEFILKELFQDSTMQTLVGDYFNDNYIGTGKEPSEKFYIAMSDYLFNIKNYDQNVNVQNKFRSTKESYSSNFSANSKNNGLAAPWIYNQNTSTGFYNITNLYNATTPIYGAGSYREEYLKAMKSYITALAISPLASTENTFKFSQMIYSNDFYLNLSIYDYMKNNGSIFADKVKSEVLDKNVNTYFETRLGNQKFLKFNESIYENIKPADLNILNYQLVNVYYGQDFNNKSGNKFIDWTRYNTNALSNNAILTPNQLNEYKENIYKESFEINKNNIYTKMFDAFLLASTVKYLLNDDNGDGDPGDKFMESLKDQVIYGRDFYFVWADGLNGKLESDNRNITSEELLNINRMKINDNNNYASKYFSNSGTLLTSNATEDVDGDNLYTNSTYGTQSNHYNIMKNKDGTEMLGYAGLQSLESNSLPSVVVEKLFNSQRDVIDINDTSDTSSKGVLYQYGKRDQLVKHINEIKFISDIETLANNISKELGGSFDIDSINKATTISLKKKEFIKQIENPAIVPDDAFIKFQNYISKEILPDTSTVNFYGAYAQQINYHDVSQGFNTFLTQQGADIVFNLLITTAMNEKYRNIVLNEITSNNKFDVFDLNAEAALSPNWIVEKDEDKK